MRNNQLHSREQFYQCTKCDYKGAAQHSMSRHMQLHSEANFKCTICGYGVATQLAFRIHMNRAHPDVEHKSTESYSGSNQRGNLTIMLLTI